VNVEPRAPDVEKYQSGWIHATNGRRSQRTGRLFLEQAIGSNLSMCMIPAVVSAKRGRRTAEGGSVAETASGEIDA
jgi:hypothetical protein